MSRRDWQGGRDGRRLGLSRRGFLGSTGGVLSGFFLMNTFPTDLPAASVLRDPAAVPDPPVPSGYHPGIQLYTLRELLEKDSEGTLAALAKIGYREVELAGTYGKSATEFRAMLDRVGLMAKSGHCGIPEVTTGIKQTIADAKTLGQKYVIVASLPDEMKGAEGYRKAAQILNLAAAELEGAGLRLGYHNHDVEFAPLESGLTGYDLLLEETNPKTVVFELDLFWIRKAGGDALAKFEQHRGRFRLVHIKDMAADGSMVDVGKGAMDWATLLKAAKKAGVTEYFVEHDDAKDGLGFARTAYDTISRLKG